MKKNILMLLLPLLLLGCGKEQKVLPANTERPAFTFVVGALGEDRTSVYSGEIRARYETVLGFRIGGKIVERAVDVGAVVRKGQVLARLDAADTGLQESAASAQLRLAEDEASRYRELREKGFVSQSVLDAKETALNSAKAQAGLVVNQAAYTTLLADRDGVVSAILAEVGQVVSAGQAVVRLAQEGNREVAIAIPESGYSSVKVGMLAQIELSAALNDTKILNGRVREISPAADPASRTYAARVALNAENSKVALGMTARVKINSALKGAQKKNSEYLIPLTSVFQQGNKAAVWIVAADRSVSLRPVEVKAYSDDGALVSSGIAAGERIISAGVHMLTAGDKVKIIENGKAL